MPTDASDLDSRSVTGSQPKVNALSVASLVLAGVAVSGLVFVGVPLLAIFSVGAGHVALQQIKTKGERGAVLAYVGLGISYLVGVYALITMMYFAFAFST